MKTSKSKPKDCRHAFRFLSSTGSGAGGRTMRSKLGGETFKTVALTLTFRCDRCGDRVERAATRGERAFFKVNVDVDGPLDVHAVWHALERRFKRRDGRYRWTGIALMDRLEAWAKSFPEDVRIVSVDDAAFASSILVLVEHRAPRAYMGTTVVVVPQCTGEPPIEFFLYPCDRRGLQVALAAIASAARPVARAQRKDEIGMARAVRRNLQHPPVL